MRIKVIVVVLLILVFGVVGIVYFSDDSGEAFAIDQDQFVNAYVELATLAEQMPIGTDEYELAKARVLQRIGLEPGQVEQALARYNERPDLWRPIWERIQDELKERVGDIEPAIPPPAGSRVPDST